MAPPLNLVHANAACFRSTTPTEVVANLQAPPLLPVLTVTTVLPVQFRSGHPVWVQTVTPPTEHGERQTVVGIWGGEWVEEVRILPLTGVVRVRAETYRHD